MARQATKDLTARELEVMHAFWMGGEMTAADARERLAAEKLDLAYVTVANLVRILVDKGYLKAVNESRPFIYRPCRSFREVSGSFLGDLVDRVFGGSREKMLAQLFSNRKRLTKAERELLEKVLEEKS